MGKRRKVPATDERQMALPVAWVSPARVLEKVEAARPATSKVVYEAPEISRLVLGRATRLPKVRVAPAAAEEILSLGLPFGVRDATSCWTCGEEISSAVRVGPGLVVCARCGARIPFGE